MTCLPFGLSSAPQIFAKVSNWVAGYLRGLGLRIVVYLDDFLLASQDPQLLLSQTNSAIDILQSLGWIINFKKSQLTPIQVLQFLGIMWNPSLDVKYLPQGKRNLIQEYLVKVVTSGLWSWKIAMKIIGFLSFAAFVIPFGRIHYRRIQWGCRHLPRSQPLKLFSIPEVTLVQIQWWLPALHRVSHIFARNPEVFITTDASDSGWGVLMNDRTSMGTWSAAQEIWHINVKELFAVRKALELNLLFLRGKSILVQSDNLTVVAYIRKEGGTRSLPLLRETESLFHLAESNNIFLTASYIPGIYNNIADSLSRQKALPDWHLSEVMLKWIFQQWGTPVIDLFATKSSAVVPMYVSRSALDRQAYFIDAFSRSWTFPLAWVFPPPPLLPRVLQHLLKSQGRFIIIAPNWEKVFWLPDLKRRALAAPLPLGNLKNHLIDLASGLPPPGVSSLNLQAWLVRGG
uniref:Enzymatic polyprotein n=1 Tax=Cacopsylla melanoneura TaxID=428564 RepID=A0A8D8QUR0_9HEMI